MSQVPRRFEIELIDAETIVERGTRKVTWFVRTGDAWTHPAELEGAEQEDLSAGPGTVWERVTRVLLPVDTRLLRIETRPDVRAYEDPLSYLRREVRGTGRASRRTEYRVTRRGTIVPTSAKP